MPPCQSSHILWVIDYGQTNIWQALPIFFFYLLFMFRKRNGLQRKQILSHYLWNKFCCMHSHCKSNLHYSSSQLENWIFPTSLHIFRIEHMENNWQFNTARWHISPSWQVWFINPSTNQALLGQSISANVRDHPVT